MHAPTHAHTVHSYNTETYTVSIDLQTYTTQRDAYHKETMRLSSMHSSRRLVKTEGGSLKYNMGCHFWRGFWIVVVRTKLSYAELANLSAHNSQHTSKVGDSPVTCRRQQSLGVKTSRQATTEGVTGAKTMSNGNMCDMWSETFSASLDMKLPVRVLPA